MKIRIQVAIDAEDGDGEKVEDIVQLERGALRPEELGLTLAEAKAILHGMQQALVAEQVAAYVAQFKSCPQCGARRTRKGITGCDRRWDVESWLATYAARPLA